MLCFVRSDSDILESSWLNRAAASLTSNDDGSAPSSTLNFYSVPPVAKAALTLFPASLAA